MTDDPSTRMEATEIEIVRIAMEDAVIRAMEAGMSADEILESVRYAMGMA